MKQLQKDKVIGERTMTKAEWYDDWKFYKSEDELRKTLRFRWGNYLWKLSHKLERYGWKQMAKAEETWKNL